MNFTQIGGHIGKDPEVRFTPDGKKVTSFTVAVNKKKKGQDITSWYRVTVWGDQFEKMMPYLKKGSAVIVVGDCEARIYTDKEGRPQISLEMTAWNISFSPFGKSTTPGSSSGESSHSAREDMGQSEPMKGSFQPSYTGGYDADENDNLPF